MDHRRTPARNALTLPGWIIALSALVCLGAAAYYALLLTSGDNDSATPRATATVTTATPSPSPSPTPAPTPAPTPKPTVETSKTKPPVARGLTVDVFNNTGTSGLARSIAGRVQAVGWKVGAIGNWRGQIPQTTVYYPPGFESQAQTLARDLSVGRIRAAVDPMNKERLTLILSGQQ